MDGSAGGRYRLRRLDTGFAEATGYPSGYAYRAHFQLYRADRHTESWMAHGVGHHDQPAAAAFGRPLTLRFCALPPWDCGQLPTKAKSGQMRAMPDRRDLPTLKKLEKMCCKRDALLRQSRAFKEIP